MKIDNPPHPPLEKGGTGGFETYFLTNKLHLFNLESQIDRFFQLTQKHLLFYA